MQCANRSDKWFKALTERYNLSDDTLTDIIHKYWIQNGTEDYFPSEVYINAQLGKGQYFEDAKGVRELWEKLYKEPIEVTTAEEKKNTVENLEKIFPASAIYVYRNNKGNLVIRVKEPVNSSNQSVKSYLDKKEYSSQELYDFKLLTEQEDVQFTDRDSKSPRTFTFQDGVTVEAPFKLNYQQEEVLNVMDEFIKSNRTTMTLSGYAGTGKTSMMEMLAQKMKKQHRNIVFSASTNKAAAVLRDRVKKAGFTAQTLNKVFGISVEVDETKPYDASNLVIKLKNANIIPGTVVVIDEASMINEENYKILNDIAKQFGLKIIYVGDEAQLAPVNETKISKVFREGGDVKHLTIVERTDDNAILKEATAIRNGQPLSGESSFNKEGKGVAYVKPSNKETIRSIVDRFVPMLKEKPDYFRILAYTNNAVARYNDAVRNKLGYTDNLPRIGEPIVGYSNWGYIPFSGKGSDAAYRFINSESYTITKVGKTDTVHITLEDGTKVPMQATEVTIADAMGNEDTLNLMDIRHNEANRQNATILAKEKSKYWSLANRSTGNTKANYLSKVNAIDKFLFVNDVITDPTRKDKYGKPVKLQSKVFDFGYAMTAHKSQGSTFTHVLVDDVDIQTAKNRRSMDFGEMVPLEETTDTTTQDVSPDMVGFSTEDFGLEDKLFPQMGVPTKTTSANIRQQLEYVAVSRATDTVTIISNNVKKEDSPLNHVRTTDSTPSTTSQPTAIENTPKPADQMNRRELWEHLESLAEPMGERSVSYTPKGKTRQEYIVRDGKVYNKKGEEVHYQGKDMNKILANLAVAEDRGVVVTYRNNDYIVDNHQNITSVQTGDIMKWGPENGDRKAIIQLAEQKFKTLIENRQNRLSEMVPELMDLLKAQGINIHDKAAMEKFLKENPQWSTKIQQFIGKKARTQFEQQLIKARPDLAIPEYTVDGIDFVKDPFSDDFIPNTLDAVTAQRLQKEGIIKEGVFSAWALTEKGKEMAQVSHPEIDATLDFLHSLEDNKENTAYIKTAIRWIANRSLTLPQDHTKAYQAFELARKKHLDLQKYNTLGELVTAPEMQPKKKEKVPFNPDKAKTFSNKRTVTTEGGRVFTVYDVENTEEGQREVCKALAAHYEMSPWCLSTFTATGEPTESAKNYWNLYRALPRKIAFENGKPVAFNSDKYGRGIAETVFRGTPVIVQGEEAIIDSTERGHLSRGIIDVWKQKGLVTESKIVPNALRLTEEAKKEIYNITGESWWDMEDTHPQDTLSDSIISEPRKYRSELPDGVQLENDDFQADWENMADLYDETEFGFGRPGGNQHTLTQEEIDELPFMQTSEGDVYGFADSKGELYFDEEKVSPNVQIHEYTHLWDRAIAQRNPKLWKRGVDLMKQTSLWNEVLNEANYGQKWQALDGMTPEKMESLIASEVHSRLTGTQGEALLNRIAKEKGSKGIVAKLKQWILDFWKELKGTFSNWSDEEINKITLDDFNKMTVRDLIDKVNLKEQQPPVQQQVIGENISSRGSAFAKRLTNPFNNETVEFRGTKFDNAEHAYQTWKSGKFDQRGYDAHGGKVRGTTDYSSNYQTMVEILTAKFQQHPDLVEGIAERGGEAYLKASTHDVVGDKYWETKTGQNKFIEALTEAYKTINEQKSRSNKTANLISATIAPYFNTSYEDYAAMTPEEQKEMREAFAKAAKEVAKALGITLNMKEASFNIGGYEFDEGGSIIEPSFTFRLDTTPENARLFAALMGDLGYEQQEAVVSNYDISDRDSADGIRFSLEFKDSATLLKLINQFDIKNFTYDKTNGVLSVLSFDAADVEKFHKLVQQLKENGYDKESETFYFKSSYDGRTGRKTLYGKWLKAQEGNSKGVQSELYNLVQEALKRVNYYSGKPSNYKGLVEPDEDTVFVFGSNPKGIHGDGAAATAKAKFGAIQGQGEGLQGNAYALPTKDLDKAKGTRWYKPSKKEEAEVKEWYKTHDYSEVQNHPLNAERTMTPQQIIESIKRLYEVANQNPDKLFKVSHYPFGQLSLNGYLGEEMLAMFKQAGQIPSNVVFNKEWTDHWDEIQLASQATVPEGSPSGITVELPGYEYFNDLYEDTAVDAEWKVPMLQELDAQLSTKNTQEQNYAILAQMDRILDATSEEDLYGPLTKKQAEVVQQKLGSIGELNQKINNLYESNLLPASEVLHVAELIMNSITDDVTRLQKEPGLAKQWFPSLTTELDFQNATRKEIIETVGINRLIQAAKKNFDSSEHEYDDIETEFQADLITENWDAIVSFGTKIFAMNEGFGIKMDYKNGGYILANGMKLGFDDLNDQQDIDSIREQVGDEQEHWQIEQRTLDILNNASEVVRMAIHDCYKIGKDGKPIVSKWGIKERMNPREAINSILSWTQGALTLDDMVSRLMEKQIQHPWLSQLTDKLKVVEGQENPNADFQSQFFNTMCRSYQSYSIVLLDNGKYAAVPVSDHPSLTDIMQSITAQFRIKEHPLFRDKNGKEGINEELLGSEKTTLSEEFNLHKASYELNKIAQDLSNGEELSAEMLERAKDDISGTLKTLGYTPEDTILDTILNADTIQEMAKYTGYIVNSLDKALEEQKKGKAYDPFGFKSKNGIAGTLRNLLTPITDVLDEVVPNVVYDDGKLYQAYVTPSYLTLLFEKFHWEDAQFKEFIEKEYGYSEWFKYANSGDEGWRGGWLKMLATDKASRDLFAHTVELNFNKRRYMRNMTDAEYTISLFTHYFAEDAEGKDSMVPAWFRVPIQSNKPSSEFIKFWSYRGNSYKNNIVSGMYDMFLQEVNRIQTVRMRNLTKDRPGFIKSFDENGRKFCFLPYLNDYLSEGKKENRTLLSDKDSISAEKRNEKLANYLQNIEKLSTVDNDSEMRSLVMEAIQNYMQQRADEILNDYEKKGLIEAAKTIKDIYPETLKSKEEQTAWVRNQLENFIWNDYYAANNILQLTLGDKAASKDADEMQKRLAQLHAPGIRANIKVTDYEGNRVSDGTYRTIILKDFELLKSNIIENLTEYLDREIEKATADQKEAWKAIKEDLVGKNGKFREINVVDGQGYSSPSSYRKKALMFGRWSKQAENIYQNLKNGDFTIEDIETAFQPLKPFVYSQLHKDMGITNAPITKMPIPFQAKNSEYLLIMADALLQGQQTGRPNMLRAIYRVMEDSELLNPTKGIDTVQFESAIKSGLQGAVDINQFMYEENGEEKAYAYLNNLIYKKDAEGAQTKEYDTQNFVHEASYEGYCLQQEVPEHFRNHNQTHGSQERMIIPSDLVAAINGETVYYEWTDPDGTKRKATAEEFGREYENTIAENIDNSIKQLRAELKLDSRSTKERNLALSEILQKEILDSSRYGIDMFLACGLDPETGDFRVPLGDPIQAKRIEQLLNSIIKSRINKQEIAGGPIVQVTNWGTSKQLHIRFKDKDSGELLMTEEEYDKVGWSQYVSYKDYLKHRQGGIAYFEVFAPAWSKDLYQKFMDKDGNIDIGAIEILNPDLLKMISYRIPTEEKYSIAPMKVVGFMPERAGSAIMFPYELTEIDDSDFDVDKRYVMRKVIEIGTRYEIKENENATEAEKDYIKHNKKSITQYLQKAVNLQGKTTAEEREAIEKEAKAAAEVDKRTAKRAHEERLATIEKRNAMVDEAEAKTEFSKDPEKSDEIYDKRVDKQEKWYDKAVAREEQRYQIELDKIDARTNETISKEITRLENKKASERINQFITIDRWNNSSQDDKLTRQLRIAYLRYMHPTYEPTSGKIANDNKIIDMSWGVLTHEAIAFQLLNPGGFDNFKKIGYQIAAFKNPNNTKSWEELGKMSVSELQDLHHSTKDLAWVDTQVEYYRQNAAAASLIGIFAVNKIAHAMLERDHLQINVEEFCGEEPFEIDGKLFGGMIDVDPTFDDTGKRIGKTIGSGVSASADAAKTPALHLMNVNLSTVNIFTTLLRLGVPEETAGLFCSQNIISEVLDEFNKKNLNNYEPMANIIEQRLLALRKEEFIAENSNINTQGLSRDELIEGLRDTKHSEIDYKVLLALQKIRNLSDAMRKPTFATRFNSISSAVGPQIIDNLILEHKMEQFGQNGDETGFYDKEGNPVTINDIFEMHPVLRAFAEAVDIAKVLFRDMPTGSNSFRNLLKKLPANIADIIYNDKKLLSDLSNFYQSYLLINEGMVDESKLKDYIEKFPKEFMEKDTNGKSIQDKYPNNALIQNIKLISSKKTGRSFLTIKLTGEDETTKDIYRTAWIDLHKKNPELSQKLFEYFFFRAGIGFSPKTGMALVPTFVKERLSTKKENGTEITYSDVYRKLPELGSRNERVIDQFIRNNWNESKLVPKKGGEGTNYKIDLNEGRLTAFTESDVADLQGVEYMRTYQNGQTYLWKLIGNEGDKENQKHRVYRRIKPLGDNNEYLEMSTNDIVKPYSETTLDIEDNDASELQSKSPSEVSAEQQVPVTPSDTQITLTMELVEKAIAAQWEANGIMKSQDEVKQRAKDIKGKERQNAKFMVNALKKLGLEFTEEDFIREFKKLC